MALFGNSKKAGTEDKGKTSAKKTKAPAFPQSVADTIPYDCVYENGVIEIKPRHFSKSYFIPAVNFKTAPDSQQWKLAEEYSDFMNGFDAGVSIEITEFNRTIDVDKFEQKVFIKAKADNLNGFREEYNHMLSDKMKGAKNNLETEKILTVTLQADDIVAADERFAQIDSYVTEGLANMTKHDVRALTLVERLDILNEIMNGDQARPIYETRMIEGHLSESFSLENCAKQGITTKQVIAPPSFEFMGSQGKTGDRLVRSYFVKTYPTYIRGTILTDFATLPANMLTSVYFTPLDQDKAYKMLKQQGVNINSEVVESEKKAAKSGIFGDIALGSTLSNAKDEIKDLTNRVTKDNVKLFSVLFLFTLFADTEEELKALENNLKLIGSRNLLTIQPLNMQQEAGFATALPLGHNKLALDHLMTSHSIASIIPFDVQEIRQEDGMYYGLNAESLNMILYNRSLDKVNPNGCILGMPGSGKSFSAKREMINVLLNTDDDIYVIDPEREYKRLAEAFGGSVIKIAAGSSVYINPFDLNLENADDDGDPVKIKSSFIETIIEIMIGGKFGLTAVDKSIIGRCVTNIYEPYVQYLKRKGKTHDEQRAPTLKTFYNELCNQPNMEAQNLALALERYVSGSLDFFSHHSNVKIDNRFVVYDVKDIGPGLKESGLQIALDNIWNRMIENHAKGKRTWFYIDEFYLMMQKPSSAEYIANIWKRARKWHGVPCAITQNVEDMLKSQEARTIINTSQCVIILGQSPMNLKQLADMMSISPSEQKYISSAKPGRGLIHIGDDNIPMDDNFPKDTELYKIMTTNVNE